MSEWTHFLLMIVPTDGCPPHFDTCAIRRQVGPEGDFTPDEVERLVAAGALPVRGGRGRGRGRGMA